jgi:hypothetical protein
MALRRIGAARLGRAASGRAGFVALACVLYLAAGILAAWPAVEHWRTAYLAGGAPGYGEASPGDYLQTNWHFWLFGQQLEHLLAPWHDPYTFRPESGGVVNLGGWPFGLPTWPLFALFGPVVAWNLFTLLSYVGAGGLTCAWLRALGLGRGPAIVGGLVFAIAPYRVGQSVGHLLGPISMLLPLALLGVEKGGRRWGAVAVLALASIPLSGQVHLALGAIPFVAAYAFVRRRVRIALVASGAAIACGLLVQREAIAGSISAGGRSLAAVGFYSATWSDFVLRSVRHGNESFVFLGWLTPLVALAGLVILLRGRRFGLAVVLSAGVVVPSLLALGTHLPSYSWLWQHVDPFRYPRVPERLMPIACLSLAALVAFAVPRRRVWAVTVVAVVLLAADLHVHAYAASAADRGNAAYTALRGEGPGRLLELPVFRPDIHYGSVYFSYAMQAPRQRPMGYSTVAPVAANDLANRLERLNCGDWTGIDLARLGVRYVTLHQGLFTLNTATPNRAWFASLGLARHGWRKVARGGVVTLWARGAGALDRVGVEPPRTGPVLCQGWYGPDGGGVPMSETHAPLWVYGSGSLALWVMAAQPLATTFGVDEHPVARRLVSAPRRVVLPLGPTRRWHLVTLDVPRLVPTEPRATGVRLLSIVPS